MNSVACCGCGHRQSRCPHLECDLLTLQGAETPLSLRVSHTCLRFHLWVITKVSWCLGIAQVNPSARGRARLYVHCGSGLEAWRRWPDRPGSGDRLRSLCSTGQPGRCPAGTQGARPKPRLQGKRHLPGVRQASKWPAIAPPCSCSDPESRPSAHGAPRAAAASAASFHLRPPPAFGARLARRRIPDPSVPSATMHSLFRKKNKGKYSPTVQTRR